MQPSTVKGADLMVRALENEGVETIFGVPGEENLDFLEALRTSSIRVVVTRHEQVAGIMAATYGRLTGRPGVCFSTLGPGPTNLVTPAAFASLGGMPMVIITGQKPILHSRQARFQIIDTVSLMRPLTKAAKQVLDARNIPTLVRDAFRLALAERPGPPHPLLLIGGGATRPGLAPELSAAVRRLGIPFFNTQMGKGAVDGNSALF